MIASDLTYLKHPTVTAGGEAIEAPIVPGSALMLTAVLTYLLQDTGPQIICYNCDIEPDSRSKRGLRMMNSILAIEYRW